MFNRAFVGFWFLLSACLTAVEVNWAGPLQITPAPAVVGSTVQVRYRLTVNGGAIENLTINGRIDGVLVYNQTFPKIEDKSLIVPVNWVAAHASRAVRRKGQPSRVAVEFTFSTPQAHQTQGTTVRGVIVVQDGFSRSGLPEGTQPIGQVLDDCQAHVLGQTDLELVSVDFNYKIFGKFSYRIVFRNAGPRCLRSLKFRISYPHQGQDRTYEDIVVPAGADGWLIKAGETRPFSGEFDRHKIPADAFIKEVDSEVQEISFTLNGLKITLDPGNEISETNEGNNTKTINLSWVEK